MNPRFLLIATLAAAGCGGLGVPKQPTIHNGVVPDNIVVNGGQSIQFQLVKKGLTQTDVHWTCSGGSITQSGKYTAPDTAGNYSVTAQKGETFSSASVTVP